MKTITGTMIFIVMFTMSITSFAQQREFKDGTVWAVSFIKVSANMGEDYLNSLKNSWKAVNDEAMKQGLIVSFKILTGAAANPDDWNIMLMTEFKNMASMEGQDEKWDAIEKKVLGSEENMKKLNESRVSIRTIYGNKLLREVIYK